jgi:hypothetical protein
MPMMALMWQMMALMWQYELSEGHSEQNMKKHWTAWYDSIERCSFRENELSSLSLPSQQNEQHSSPKPST